ncbi:MAG: AMP-binding protein [Calditrichaceae bacterium]
MKFGLSRYTLDLFFDKVVQKYSDRPSLALVGEKPITYAEFAHKVEQLKLYLTKIGLKKNDKIVILGNSTPNWAIAFMAVTTLGCVAVPVMDEFPEADIQNILKHSEATGIFISEYLFQSMDIPSITKMKVVLSLSDFMPLPDKEEHKNIWEHIQNLPKKIIKSLEKDPDYKKAEIHENDLAEILYTSGTTGQSKGVMLTHKNLVSNLFEGPDLLGVIDDKSVVLTILPMAHAFGSTSAFLSIIYCGSSIYYLNQKPSPKVLMNAMQKVRPHIIGAVPLVFEKIYHKQVLPVITEKKVLKLLSASNLGRKLVYKLVGKKIKKAFGGRLKCAIIGGASLNREVEIFLRTGGIPYAAGYGLSECSPLVTFSSMATAKIESVGHAITGVKIKIVDPDPVTGIGEIYVSGPNVMKGYYKNDAETKKVFTGDGWFITGDRGYLDHDGFLFIKGRSKNVIIGSSGENIYPEVIENKLKESDYVEEALVYMLNNKLTARIYPDYNFMQNSETEQAIIANEIENILEKVKVETNAQLPSASRIQKVIEQTEPFLKTPTNKIKRAVYVPDYAGSEPAVC